MLIMKGNLQVDKMMKWEQDKMKTKNKINKKDAMALGRGRIL